MDVDTCGLMNAKTTREIIAMTVERVLRPEECKDRCGEHPEWKTNMLPEKIMYGTKRGEIPGPLKVDKGALRELG